MTNLVIAVLMLASHERLADAGHLTKYGERFHPENLTCATWLWPSNTLLRVTDIHNGSSVLVRAIDTPAKRFRKRIDLSPAAFAHMNGLALGVCEVRVTPVPAALPLPPCPKQHFEGFRRQKIDAALPFPRPFFHVGF